MSDRGHGAADVTGNVDAITLSILWARLLSIVDEAGSALQRTAFSTVTANDARRVLRAMRYEPCAIHSFTEANI